MIFRNSWAKLVIYYSMLTIVYFFVVVRNPRLLLKYCKTIYINWKIVFVSINWIWRTEFITFSLKNDKRLNDLETVFEGSTIVKKSNHCKHLGVTNDEHLGFQTQGKKVLKNMAAGIKTVGTVQHRFPMQVFLMRFHALVMKLITSAWKSIRSHHDQGL